MEPKSRVGNFSTELAAIPKEREKIKLRNIWWCQRCAEDSNLARLRPLYAVTGSMRRCSPLYYVSHMIACKTVDTSPLFTRLR